MAPLLPHHAALLEARGLDGELLARLGVHTSKRLSGDCIAIPYTDDGVVVNHKYRTLSGDKAFAQDAGAKKCLWNIDCLRDVTLASGPLIVTEGEFDAMAAMQAGFPRTVSVPDGAPAQTIGEDGGSVKYSYLDDAEPLLRDVREIILATDSDGPGVNLMNDLALRLGRHRCKWVKYPKGCKDLNDALRLFGERGVTETIARAQWCKVDGVYRMSDLPPITDPQAFEVGIPGLSEHYKVRPGDLCIVTGVPSHGKSSFVNDVVAHMAERHGWVSALASFEQRPQIDHRRNLYTLHSGKRAWAMSPDEKAIADTWIDGHFVFIVPDEDDDVTLEWMLNRAQAAIVQYGARLVVIDPWNEMDHTRPPDMTETEYTGFAIKQFRKLAKKYNVHVIVVAHPAKMMRQKDGTYPIPSLYDISGSSHWYNKADIGIVVHRAGETPDDSKTIVRIAKSRYHDIIGRPGDLDMRFEPATLRYLPIRQTHDYPDA